MSPETLVRQLHDQGIEPRAFALELMDFVIWLDAGDHSVEQLAERYGITEFQAASAIARRSTATRL